MKFKIYCIIDINGLKYVGKTKLTFEERLKGHRTDKKNNKCCSSELLDLYNCEMILLCECDECDAPDREQYFKDNIKCVNIRNMIFDRKEYHKQYYINNKQRKNNFNKLWIKNNEKKHKQYQNEYRLFNGKKICNGCYEFIQMLNSY